MCAGAVEGAGRGSSRQQAARGAHVTCTGAAAEGAAAGAATACLPLPLPLTLLLQTTAQREAELLQRLVLLLPCGDNDSQV